MAGEDTQAKFAVDTLVVRYREQVSLRRGSQRGLWMVRRDRMMRASWLVAGVAVA